VIANIALGENESCRIEKKLEIVPAALSDVAIIAFSEFRRITAEAIDSSAREDSTIAKKRFGKPSHSSLI
jgi:hypothetical protein